MTKSLLLRKLACTGLLLAGSVALVPACNRFLEQGTVMLVLQSELRAGTDINAIALYVKGDGGRLFNATLTQVIAQNAVEARGALSATALPATLAISTVDSESATAITIKVVAFRALPGVTDAAVPTTVREVRVQIPTSGVVAVPIAFTYANLDTADGPTLSFLGSTAGGRSAFDSFNYGVLKLKAGVCAEASQVLADDGGCRQLDAAPLAFDEGRVFGGGASNGENAKCFQLSAACVSNATGITLPSVLRADEQNDIELAYPAGVSSMAGRTLLAVLKPTANVGECAPTLANGACVVALAGPEPATPGVAIDFARSEYAFNDATQRITLKPALVRRFAGELESVRVAPTCCGARSLGIPTCFALLSRATPTNSCN